jgi:ABC-2 type transport system ATP-binding protein
MKGKRVTAFAEAVETIVSMEAAGLDFGGGAGVFDLDIHLSPGTILGLIGPSGCGKTTTIRLVNGVSAPTAGTVRVLGVDPQRFGEAERGRIGYIPQQFILYPNLSVEENLHFLGSIYGMPRHDRRTRIQPLLEFVELTDARKRLSRKLSGGMQRRLMLAGALLHDPDLLIADEPTAGIDPILRARIWENFRSLRDQGKTLLVTTQYVGEAAYCDLVAVMRRGRLITVDTPRGLQRQAMGGDVIHMQIPPRKLPDALDFLERQPKVFRVERQPDDPGGLFLYVDDAGKQLPVLLNRLRDQLKITPQVAEPYLPPFDEVFVRLVQQTPELEAEKVAI